MPFSRWIAAGLVALAMTVSACTSREEPTLTVTATQVDSSVEVHLEITGFQIGKDGHPHIRLDDGPEAMPGKNTYTFRKVPPGRHRIFVELADVRHNPIGVSETIEIEVVPAAETQ